MENILRIAPLIIAGLLFTRCSSQQDKNKQTSLETSSPPPIEELTEKVYTKQDTIEGELEIQKLYRENITGWINMIDTLNMGSADSIDITLITGCSGALFDAEASKDSFQVNMAKKLRPKLKLLQVNSLPKIRLAYMKKEQDYLFSLGITLKAYKPNYTTIAFIGVNDIKSFHDKILPELKRYRFKKAKYAWTEEMLNAGGVQEIKIDSPNDDVIYSYDYEVSDNK